MKVSSQLYLSLAIVLSFLSFPLMAIDGDNRDNPSAGAAGPRKKPKEESKTRAKEEPKTRVPTKMKVWPAIDGRQITIPSPQETGEQVKFKKGDPHTRKGVRKLLCQYEQIPSPIKTFDGFIWSPKKLASVEHGFDEDFAYGIYWGPSRITYEEGKVVFIQQYALAALNAYDGLNQDTVEDLSFVFSFRYVLETNPSQFQSYLPKWYEDQWHNSQTLPKPQPGFNLNLFKYFSPPRRCCLAIQGAFFPYPDGEFDIKSRSFKSWGGQYGRYANPFGKVHFVSEALGNYFSRGPVKLVLDYAAIRPPSLKELTQQIKVTPYKGSLRVWQGNAEGIADYVIFGQNSSDTVITAEGDRWYPAVPIFCKFRESHFGDSVHTKDAFPKYIDCIPGLHKLEKVDGDFGCTYDKIIGNPEDEDLLRTMDLPILPLQDREMMGNVNFRLLCKYSMTIFSIDGHSPYRFPPQKVDFILTLPLDGRGYRSGIDDKGNIIFVPL